MRSSRPGQGWEGGAAAAPPALLGAGEGRGLTGFAATMWEDHFKKATVQCLLCHKSKTLTSDLNFILMVQLLLHHNVPQ